MNISKLHISLLYGFNEQFSFITTIGGLIFTLVIGVFIFIIVKSLTTWTSNNAAEIIKKKCKVTDKRTEVWGGAGDSMASTNYYITFEFEDHSRKEFSVKDKHFGLVSIGDKGELTYQGTRFNEFNRSISDK